MGTDLSGTLQPGRGQTINPGDRCQEDTHVSQGPITTNLFVHRGTPYVICGQDRMVHQEANGLFHLSLDRSFPETVRLHIFSKRSSLLFCNAKATLLWLT